MIATISGYQLKDLIYESEHSLVFQGSRLEDNMPVVLKMLKQAYPPPERIAWFKREYELTRGLNVSGAIRVYDLITDQHRPVMVVEDIGGESLAYLMKKAKQFTVAEFLSLASNIIDILEQVHQHHVIHKDVNPSNILLNPTSGQVRLIDFGISAVIAREESTLRNLHVLEGTLAYISPEQTGRMNRSIDYRTDYYSLGVTFYELLAGQLPFTETDAMALVHSHIAKQPTPLHVLKPDIPQPLSDIVAKLMAKNAEDRYQSTHGLKADLEECLWQWQATRFIDAFAIGSKDISDHFQISQKLYGRQQEIETLLNAFDRVSQGADEIMLVSGSAGIGKSVLVQELYKPITRQRGYFIAGKFDLLQRNIPYAALTQAFQSMIRQLLSEDETHIVGWRDKLLTALGPNGQIIIDLIPEVELIIGPQPAVPILSPTEGQNRFNHVFQSFIRVFTAPEHPLVIFLDDLQWADAASLNLLQTIMTSPDSQYLFVIGAYRDNEVTAAHPLMLVLDEVQKAGSIVNTIFLGSLDLPNITELIADTLNCVPAARGVPLAELVLAKTDGNPFFVNEFLRSLYAEELLLFNHHRGSWQWDLEKMQARDMTNNVIELMSDKVQKLNEKTQQVLKLAACIGSHFDIQTLATVYDKSVRETATDLWGAIAEGMVVPLGAAYKLMELDVEGLGDAVAVEYKFGHDRIQQATYSLIPEAERQTVHLQIGRLLKRNLSAEQQEQGIFDIVNQLNSGRNLMEQEERNELAELNLLAGKKAKTSAAYHAAFEYLWIAIEMLNEESWEQQYALTLEMYVEAAEAAYLSGNLEQMEQLVETILQRATTLNDKVKAYHIRLHYYHNHHKIFEAIKTGLQVLALLEVALPDQPTHADIGNGLGEVSAALAGKEIEELVGLPEMTDPRALAATQILDSLYSPSYVGQPELFLLIVCKFVSLSIQYGNTPRSAYAYAAYGFILCGLVGNINDGNRFGELALKLVDRFDARAIQAGTLLMVNGFIRHWKEHIRETLKPLLDGYQIGLETGDFTYGALCAFDRGVQSYWVGCELRTLESEMGGFSKAIEKLKQGHALHLNQLYHQTVLNLIAADGEHCDLVGTSYDETQMLPGLLETNNINALCQLYLHKSVLCYLFGRYAQAVEHIAQAEQYIAGVLSTTAIPACCLYGALTRLAIYQDVSESEQQQILEHVASSLEKMKVWAEHAPMNYQHKWYLMEAERANVLGNDSDARAFYDKAIDLAREHGYVSEEALAHELAFRFYISRGQQRIARHYLYDAHYAYRQWGAEAKVKQLETQYPQFLLERTQSMLQTRRTTFTTRTGESSTSALDLASVLKASQAISGEIMLDKLLTMLMRIVIENAGAQTGYLLLEKKGQWVIEAEVSVDKEEMIVLQSVPLDASVHGKSLLPVTVINYVARMQKSVVLNDAAQDSQFASDPYIASAQPKSIMCAPLINQGKLYGILYLENDLATSVFTPDRLEVLNLLSAQAAISIENAQLYTNITALNQAYERFIPHQFLSFLNKESIIDVQLGDQVQKEMTILFSDIRDFTPMSEKMTPEDNFRFLNDYLSRMEPHIVGQHGFIDKYIGDAIMALFPASADDAVRASIAMLRELNEFNFARQQSGNAPIKIGIGLHSGMLMLGTVGGHSRMDGTVISDAVNLASRVEGLTKLYGISLLLTESVYKRLHNPHEYSIREIDCVRVKGKTESITLYEVFDGDPAPSLDLKMTALDDFGHALHLYRQQAMAESHALFEQVWKANPQDMAALMFLNRCEQLQHQGVPPNWDGVEVLFEK